LLLKGASRADFRYKNEVSKISGRVFGTTKLVPSTDPLMIALHFVLNRPELFELVSEVSGVDMPGNFLGRVHRTEPSSDLHIDWHDDFIDGRVLGLNLNLSTEPFSGGLFQIRGPDRQTCGEVHFENPGDAFLFRIGDGWQHRLTPVEGGVRTVGVGWFRTGVDWHETTLSGVYNGRMITY
jgi:hypothetical protein